MKNELKKLAEAQAEYEKVAHDKPEIAKAAHVKVQEAKQAIVARITAGAKPCPKCGKAPHGMRQPRGAHNFEFEIGCLGCTAFKHDDGTVREFRVRGGLIPKHAVDAWNIGPDAWNLAKDQTKKAEPFVPPAEWGATKLTASEEVEVEDAPS